MSKVPELIAKVIVDSKIGHPFVYPGGLTIPVISRYTKAHRKSAPRSIVD